MGPLGAGCLEYHPRIARAATALGEYEVVSESTVYAVQQYAWQILWQCCETQSLGRTHLKPRCAYIRIFLLGRLIQVTPARIFFGPGLMSPSLLLNRWQQRRNRLTQRYSLPVGAIVGLRL